MTNAKRILGILYGLIETLNSLWPFKSKRVVGWRVEFPSLRYYQQLSRGEITKEEWSGIPEDKMCRRQRPIYDDGSLGDWEIL